MSNTVETAKSNLVDRQAIERQILELRQKASLSNGQNVVLPTGDASSGVLIFGENPGYKDMLAGEPLVGPYSQIFNEELLPVTGLSRKNIYLTNLIKFNLPGNRDPEDWEIDMCQPILLQEIEYIQPKIIVAMGKHAAGVFLGRGLKITKVHGKTYRLSYPNFNCTLLVTMHPASVYHNDYYLPALRSDFLTLKRLVMGEILDSEDLPSIHNSRKQTNLTESLL